MARSPCCDKANVKRGAWSPDEDKILRNYIEKHGIGDNWVALPRKAGLKRCGKSCRLRWLNYLRPGIKHGDFTQEEDNIICSLYSSIGSRWSVMAARLPGRTDNDLKNYWNTKLKKKFLAGNIGSQLDKNSNNQIKNMDSPSSSIISTSGQFSSSSINIPTEAEKPAGYGSDNTTITSPNSYMSHDMSKYRENYDFDYPGLLLDQIDQFPPLPGLMEYGTATATANNSTCSLSSSQEVSSLSSPSSCSMEKSTNPAAACSGAEVQDILMDDLDFEGLHHLFNRSSFQQKTYSWTEVAAPCFGIFSSSSLLSNST